MAKLSRYVLATAISLCLGCEAGAPLASSPSSRAKPEWTTAVTPVRRGAPPLNADDSLAANPYWNDASGPFGTSETNPIRVASLAGITPHSTRLYFSRLRSPDGQVIRYRRLGSCCQFPSPNAPFGPNALLDRYEVTYAGLSQPIVLYINFYDPGELRAPDGFVFE